MTENENVCYAKSSPTAALVWITLAFFAGFAGVSAYGPIIAKLKQTMAMSPRKMGRLASGPAWTGSLLRSPFGALVVGVSSGSGSGACLCSPSGSRWPQYSRSPRS